MHYPEGMELHSVFITQVIQSVRLYVFFQLPGSKFGDILMKFGLPTYFEPTTSDVANGLLRGTCFVPFDMKPYLGKSLHE